MEKKNPLILSVGSYCSRFISGLVFWVLEAKHPKATTTPNAIHAAVSSFNVK